MEILQAFLITFGWALVGAVAMGLSLFVCLAIFSRCTKGIDEWKLVQEGSIPMAIIMASVIIACGMVVASAIKP